MTDIDQQRLKPRSELEGKIAELANPMGPVRQISAELTVWRDRLIRRLNVREPTDQKAGEHKVTSLVQAEITDIVGQIFLELGVVDPEQRGELDIFLAGQATEFKEMGERRIDEDFEADKQDHEAANLVPASSRFSQEFSNFREDVQDRWGTFYNVERLVGRAERFGNFVIARTIEPLSSLPESG